MRTIHGTFIRFTSLALLAAAGTVAGTAHSQQVLSPAPQQQLYIGAPTLETCSLQHLGYVPGTPQNVTFLGSFPAGCYSVLTNELARLSATQPQKIRPMYRADPAPWPANLASTTQNNLAQGLLDAFIEGDVVAVDSDLSYAGSLMKKGSSVIKTRTAQQAIQFRAHPDWEARGVTLGDPNNACGEWVWKGYYEYSRFEDSAAACGTDDECVYQVAYSNNTAAPGIAFRSYLKGMDANGAHFNPRSSIPLVRGFVPKNMFFGAATAFLLDQQPGLIEDMQRLEFTAPALLAGTSLQLQAGPKLYGCAGNFRFQTPTSKYYVDPSDAAAATKLAALDADLKAVRILLQKKAGYLISPTSEQIAAFPQAERFTNEWYYHKAMHDRQKPAGGQQGQPLSRAERKAIDDRTKTLADLMERYATLTSPRVWGDMALPVADDRFRSPVNEAVDQITVDPLTGERVVVDPFVRDAAVSALRGDLVDVQRVSTLESQGAVVTPQMVVPFSLGTDTSPTTPTTTTTDTVLVGVERDYGKTETSIPASTAANSLCPSPKPVGPSDADLLAIADEARKVQEKIVELLIDEYHRGSQGCLSENGYNCDWSPTKFAQRFVGKFSEKREEAFQYCVAMTGGNTLTHEDELFHVPVASRTMTGLPPKLHEVDFALKKQMSGLPAVRMGEDDVRAGESISGGKKLLDKKWFGGSYTYTSRWNVLPRFKSDAEPGDTACAFEGEMEATFTGTAHVLNNPLTLVRASARGKAQDPGNSFAFHLEFLGEAFNASGSGEKFHFVDDDQLDSGRASATVVVAAVPVTFQAWGELDYGYSVTADMHATNGCASGLAPSMGVVMQFRPYAKANAVASAAVGVSGAQAGVRGRITLLDASLPTTAGLEVKTHTGAVKLFPTVSTDLVLRTLSGNMSAFAEVGAGFARYTAEKEIFSWRGLTDNRPVVEPRLDPVYLAAFTSKSWEDWVRKNNTPPSIP
jgi:hypothetical protein